MCVQALIIKYLVMLRNHLKYSTWGKYYECCRKVDNALVSIDLSIRQRPTLLT